MTIFKSLNQSWHFRFSDPPPLVCASGRFKLRCCCCCCVVMSWSHIKIFDGSSNWRLPICVCSQTANLEVHHFFDASKTNLIFISFFFSFKFQRQRPTKQIRRKIWFGFWISIYLRLYIFIKIIFLSQKANSY
jgi:hypothetical protein